MNTVEELNKLAELYDAHAKVAEAKVEQHTKQNEPTHAKTEKARAEKAKHYAEVCRDAARKLATKAKQGAFVPPTLAEVSAEMARFGLPADQAEGFMSHYSANGWKVGRVQMVSWQAAVVNWKRGYFEKHPERRPQAKREAAGLMVLANQDPPGWREWLTAERISYTAYRFAPDFQKEKFNQSKSTK